MLRKGFVKKKTVHITFDNSDGKQQTILGDNTTHHTTGTIFQSRNVQENVNIPTNEGDMTIDICDQGTRRVYSFW